MTASEFLADAKKLILMSCNDIAEQMNELEVIHATTFFSLGIERLLKFVLADINAVFVLTSGDFKNAAPCLYKHKFVNGDQHGVTSSKPDTDVVSFRVAMQRALIFSTGVKENSQLLFSLANYRDILAHRPLSELDIVKANRLLAKDGYKLVNDICSERSLPVQDFFGANHDRLRDLSRKIQNEEDFSRAMASRIEQHKTLWLGRASQPEFIKQANDITQSLLASSGHDFSYVSFTCPACAQEAVARIEPDYDYDKVEKISYVTGVFVDSINCYYCGLNLQDYEELNYVDANSIFEDGHDLI
ncbi:hypothetical protein B0F87_107235 [Methylobacter tundripaludum]|uniref:Uncharacterized protein n=1 Tax=Methylobacter tundripaludum TaxID=173365 RepID=A0A2S6HC22_9GAMM|nr:hypothetical protein [Methylobacter tundripaludum]PPK74992.1 hypothetical protein B0F87_107235 [Methylobacter tundripaludum]